jgi:DNA-binding beta-propeller fold protein YncE
MRILRSINALTLCALVATATSPAASAAPPVYAVAQRFAVGGDGGWDYLAYDASSKHVFVSRGTHVMVVDPVGGTVVGDVADTPGVHGIAFAPELGLGFTSNGRTNAVGFFDLKTLKTTASVPVDGKNPDAIVYDPASQRVFAFNHNSNNYTAVDAKSGKALPSVALPGVPEFAAVGANGMVYVNIEDRAMIGAIDAKTNTVVAMWPLAGCESPTGLAIDVVHKRLFAGCGNGVMAIVNADTGAVVATPKTGRGTDATAFDPGTQLAFSSNGGDGTLTVIHEDSPDAYTVVQNAATAPGARTMALDTTRHDPLVVTADFTLATPGPSATPSAAPAPGAPPARPRRTMVPGSFVVLLLTAK